MVERSVAFAAVMLGLAGCCFGGPALPGLPGAGAPPPPIGTPPVGTVGTAPVGTGTVGTAPVGTAPTIGAGGLVTLAPGFLPDPQVGTGTAGGPVAATTLNTSCRGHIAAAPNHVLDVTGQFARLRIVVSSSADTTLVVQHPDGSFSCNDDTDGLNPVVAGPFGPGQHRVWIGTYSASRAGTPYVVGFTELEHVTAASLGNGGAPLVPTGLGAGGAGLAALIPQHCGMAVPFYGPIAVGTTVVLGMHTPWSGGDGQGGAVTMDINWADEMTPLVGQRTVVTELAGLDQAGCPGVRVAADNGTFFWRIRNLTF